MTTSFLQCQSRPTPVQWLELDSIVQAIGGEGAEGEAIGGEGQEGEAIGEE
jgi:hypothetical protein